MTQTAHDDDGIVSAEIGTQSNYHTVKTYRKVLRGLQGIAMPVHEQASQDLL